MRKRKVRTSAQIYVECVYVIEQWKWDQWEELARSEDGVYANELYDEFRTVYPANRLRVRVEQIQE